MNFLFQQNVEQCSQEPFPTSPLTPHPTCADINCLNGGTCQNVATPSGGIRYQCNCPIHFAGTRCEEGRLMVKLNKMTLIFIIIL